MSACLFGDDSTPATVASDTEVRCAAPARALAGRRRERRSTGVARYPRRGAVAGTWRGTEVLSLEPVSAGQVAGDATVVVRGYSCSRSSSLQGVPIFGAPNRGIARVNATELECGGRRPPTRSGPVAVEVSANGADFGMLGAKRLPRTRRRRRLTGAGPQGQRARRRAARSCVCAARTWSSRRRWRAGSRSSTCRRASSGRRILGARRRRRAPAAAALNVVDSGDVVYEATFEYTPLMAVRGASPPRGAAGTSSLAGSGFAAYATAACVFGDRRVEAVVTSDTEVVCTAPPGEGDVAVRVVSGATTAAGEAIFTYVRAPSVSNLRPSTAAAGRARHCLWSGLCRRERARLCFWRRNDASALRVFYRTRLSSACE